MTPASLLLVGCGKMGNALLSRWQYSRPAGVHHFDVIEPVQSHAHSEHVTWHTNLEALPEHYVPDVIVLAVKPQELHTILPAYRERFRQERPLYISIAAGKTLKFFMGQLGEQVRVVRAMPNIAAQVGQAMTAMCASVSVSAAGKNMATQLMQAVGDVVWLDNEAQMDTVTALSGSGPAYVFLFLESLTRAAIACGLPESVARQLAVKTAMGSAALAAQSHESLETLRKNVTSPGGTTEAALSILMQDGQFEKLLTEAVLKAVKRSHELAE